MDDFPKIPDEHEARRRFEELASPDYRRVMAELAMVAAKNVDIAMAMTMATLFVPRDRFDAWAAADRAETVRQLELVAQVSRDFAHVVEKMCVAIGKRRDNPNL